MVQRSFRFMTTSQVSDLSMFIYPEGEFCLAVSLMCVSLSHLFIQSVLQNIHKVDVSQTLIYLITTRL